MNDKSENSYKTISEVTRILNLVNKKTGSLNTHTLRFWEKQFKQVKPKILAGKRRYYDNKSIETTSLESDELSKDEEVKRLYLGSTFEM